jgi:hypothetical protein
MRSSSRLLTLLMLLAAVALTAAAPARAGPSLPVGTTVGTTTVCDRGVCESVAGTGFTVHSVKATAHAARTICGHFTMTVRTPRSMTVTNSPPVCAATPGHRFPVHKTFPVGTTIAMRFSNPLTPGRPLVRLPLR